MQIIDQYNLTLCAAVTVVVQMVFCTSYCLFKRDKLPAVADITNIAVIALLTLGLSVEFFSARRTITTVFVFVWTARILVFILKDWREIDEEKQLHGKGSCYIALFWIAQIIWVFVLCLPVIFVNLPSATWPISIIDVIAMFIYVVGFLLEAISDWQMHSFKQDPIHGKLWCTKGLWSVSRHPDYFGVILVWIAIFFFSTMDNVGAMWLAVLSPIFVLIKSMFLFGMRTSEKKADEKFRKNSLYLEYKVNTSPFIPLPTCCYAKFPDCLKSSMCCDCPFYDNLDLR